MTVVERHPIDTAFAAENAPGLAASFERNLPKVERNASRLTSLLDIALMRLGNQCAIDPTADKLDTWVSFTHATQVSSAIFAAATAEADQVECLIDQREIGVPATGPSTASDPARWQTALWLATTCRDHDRIRSLCGVGESTLRTNSDNFDDYIYSWVATLQAYFRGDQENVPRLLQETTRLLSPENATKTHPDLLNKVVRPQLLLFLQLASNDESGFNDVLRETLEAHREFWTADSRARTNPVGYIAPGPLAMVSVARDLGFTLDVESDYLPINLIRGSWITEFRF
ncbi:immunity 49 family protein [Saccharopolyspora indica]|uniref:immunity 49 family protein n=1 Tax=Saccharopolyspora indica TaxID=1229659 RepID=UPI0022EA5DE6|nr:immunity 49 family protein [Saccharopolyspora indica]MDA3646478.1 immunity 49 family protein [Saccharopolyspora indica]